MKAKDFKFENNTPYMVQDASKAYPMKRYVFVNNTADSSYHCYVSFIDDRLVSIFENDAMADAYTAEKWLPKFIGAQELATIEKITKEEFSAMVEKAMACQRAKLNKYLAL